MPTTTTAQELLAAPGALFVVVTALGVLPFAFMTLTAFVKISTVLQIVKSAIGASEVPSGAVLLALGAALTLLAMAPVTSRIEARLTPVLADTAQRPTSELVRDTVSAIREPLRAFLRANASERERTRFFELARATRPDAERAGVDRSDLQVVIPAFVVTELLEAFALGFALYLPFLVLDMVVGNVLLALGLQALHPQQVSLPFKLLLFVAIDGWGLLAAALVSGYAPG